MVCTRRVHRPGALHYQGVIDVDIEVSCQFADKVEKRVFLHYSVGFLRTLLPRKYTAFRVFCIGRHAGDFQGPAVGNAEVAGLVINDDRKVF